jgi:mRNA-degrading endonuclease RelE of RelBE toxin-antitoxin system
MEQKSSKETVSTPQYLVLWHPRVRDDLSKIAPSLVRSIIRAAEQRLRRAPLLIGQPLKGTANSLWKCRCSKYRVLYTVNEQAREIWIVAVKKRDSVYRDRGIHSLVALALAIQEQRRRTG